MGTALYRLDKAAEKASRALYGRLLCLVGDHAYRWKRGAYGVQYPVKECERCGKIKPL